MAIEVRFPGEVNGFAFIRFDARADADWLVSQLNPFDEITVYPSWANL